MNFGNTERSDNMYDLHEIADAEKALIEEAKKEYPKHFNHLQYAILLMHNCFVEAEADSIFFLTLKASIEKHLVLAALSSIRLHHVQTVLDLRYAAEAAAWAVFALAHPMDEKEYTDRDANGLPFPSKTKKLKMYTWIKKKYPKGSASLKRYKDNTTSMSTHAHIIDASRNFTGSDGKTMSLHFFDVFREPQLLVDMWSVANLSMGILGLLKRATKDYPVVTWRDDFVDKFTQLQQENEEIAEEQMVMLDKRKKSKRLS
jgi:hypothetical protein